MEKIICIEEQTFRLLLSRIEKLESMALQIMRKLKPQDPDRWIDSQEVCLVLNISKQSLQKYRDKHALTYTSIGGKVFYRERTLTEFLNARTIKEK